jgi:hypothetical protein
VPLFAAQYLEYFNPEEHTPTRISEKLRKAFALIPFNYIIIGWNLPPAVVQTCAEEAARNGAQLYRWHPVLTGDGVIHPLPEWQTINSRGLPVRGPNGLEEFTFVCPNREDVRGAILAHLENELNQGIYQGIFLDRIRYPSPAKNPGKFLACFCDDCVKYARNFGLDLQDAETALRNTKAKLIVEKLFNKDPGYPLNDFLEFREHSITRIVQAAFNIASQNNVTVALDCFSPTLTRMVGQNLSKLSNWCHWIKPMLYTRALGPAGIPFELIDLANWMTESGYPESESMKIISAGSGLPLPTSINALRENGLSIHALQIETASSLNICDKPILAGISLVEHEGINRVASNQLLEEIRVIRDSGVDGLVLSWDLWRISDQRLGEVAQAWGI